MYASRRDRSRGPFLNVIVESYPRHKVDIHASGFVSVLGIQNEAMLKISNSKYEYLVRGKFLYLFQSFLHITANYGDIKRVGFRVRGHLKSDFFNNVRQQISRGLNKFSKAATNAIENAKRKVNSKKVVFDNAVKKLSNAQRRVDNAKHAWNRAVDKLNSWKRKVKRLCNINRCGSGE